MRNQGDYWIEERLVGDVLSDYMDRVDATRDLWPGIRDRLVKRRRTGFPVFARVMVAAAFVSVLVVLFIVRPWSTSNDSMSPFTAVAHAYDGLVSLETVRYRVDGTDSLGQRYVSLHQVDMVDRIHYWSMWGGADPSDDTPSGESIIVDGNAYDRDRTGDREWIFARETRGWAPFGDFGGLPWRLGDVEDRFDRVELVGDIEIDGRPAAQYRASRRVEPTRKSGYAVVEYETESGEPRKAETVHRGADDYAVYIDTIDLWVTPDDGRLIKVDWTLVEQAPSPPADFDERDWCHGLGEFVDAQNTYRPTSGPRDQFRTFDTPPDSDAFELAKVVCWNDGRTEGRVVWGRSLAEQTGQDFWIRWVYTFTGFNEPLELPDDLP